MQTIDAQALLAHTLTADDPRVLPDVFVHARDGSLTVAFADSENTYTWTPRQVDEMAADWRALAAPLPTAVAAHITAHRHVGRMLEDDGAKPPDAVTHDLAARELRLVWHDEKRVVIVDGIGAVRECARGD